MDPKKERTGTIALVVAIVSGTIAGFQTASLPPSVSYMTMILTNPFALISVIAICVFFYILIKHGM